MSLKAREELGIAEEQATQRYEPIFSDNLVVDSRPVMVLSDGIGVTARPRDRSSSYSPMA